VYCLGCPLPSQAGLGLCYCCYLCWQSTVLPRWCSLSLSVSLSVCLSFFYFCISPFLALSFPNSVLQFSSHSLWQIYIFFSPLSQSSNIFSLSISFSFCLPPPLVFSLTKRHMMTTASWEVDSTTVTHTHTQSHIASHHSLPLWVWNTPDMSEAPLCVRTHTQEQGNRQRRRQLIVALGLSASRTANTLYPACLPWHIMGEKTTTEQSAAHWDGCGSYHCSTEIGPVCHHCYLNIVPFY
jgi:hypothetical protein